MNARPERSRRDRIAIVGGVRTPFAKAFTDFALREPQRDRSLSPARQVFVTLRFSKGDEKIRMSKE